MKFSLLISFAPRLNECQPLCAESKTGVDIRKIKAKNTGRRVRFIDYVLRAEGLLYYGRKAANLAPGPGIRAPISDNK